MSIAVFSMSSGTNNLRISRVSDVASVSLSRNTNQKYLEAVEKIRQVGQEYGIPGGVHIVEPDPAQLRHRIEEGHIFLAYGVDTRMLDVACRTGLEVV